MESPQTLSSPVFTSQLDQQEQVEIEASRALPLRDS